MQPETIIVFGLLVLCFGLAAALVSVVSTSLKVARDATTKLIMFNQEHRDWQRQQLETNQSELILREQRFRAELAARGNRPSRATVPDEHDIEAQL